MAKWWLTVDEDKSLRKALENNDAQATKKAMKDIIQEVIDTCSKIKPRPNHLQDVEYIKDEFQELLDEIEIAEEDDVLNDDEDIDHYLTELYDLCDNTKIFITI